MTDVLIACNLNCETSTEIFLSIDDRRSSCNFNCETSTEIFFNLEISAKADAKHPMTITIAKVIATAIIITHIIFSSREFSFLFGQCMGCPLQL